MNLTRVGQKEIHDTILVLLQSTNYNIPEHCNIVHSLDEFIERTKMSELIATKEQGFKVYNRYTIFGKK